MKLFQTNLVFIAYLTQFLYIVNVYYIAICKLKLENNGKRVFINIKRHYKELIKIFINNNCLFQLIFFYILVLERFLITQ